jgi:ubiquinone/menaquinone biosynthesis C-methylase UbiE
MTRPDWRRPIVLFLLSCLAGLGAPAAQNKDIKAEAARLIALLELRPGSAVADIGAGSGEMTWEMARQLGATSRIYSTDINPKTVQGLKDGAAAAALENVVVVDGQANATNLPDACCDAIFVRHVYHHFGDPVAMNASILRTLKPGGRFAVMDFPPDKPGTGAIPPGLRASGDTHGVTTATVVAELKAAGFEIIEVVPEWPGSLFLVLARRPQDRKSLVLRL